MKGKNKFEIAIVAISYIEKYDGISVYIENIFYEILEILKESNSNIYSNIYIDIYLPENIVSFFKKRIKYENNNFENVKFREIKGSKIYTKFFNLYVELYFKNQYNFIFFPNLVPIAVFNKKTIRVVHDLSYKNFPKGYSFFRKIYSNLLILNVIYTDEAIGYISETTKKDILKYFNIPKEKNFLYLPNGIPFKVKKLQRPTDEEIKNKFSQRNLKILVVGRINKHKGFDRVLEFIKFTDEVMKENSYFNSIEINFVGKRTEETDSILGTYRPKNIKMNFSGFLSDEELNKLYKESHFCFFLSRNEGYGLPLVEALWLKTIPILSDIPIFREIMGDDYIFFSEETRYGKSIYTTIKNIFKKEDYRKNIFNKIENVVQKEKDGYKIAADNLLKYINNVGNK